MARLKIGRCLFIACVIAALGPAAAQEAKPAQPDVAAANRAVLSQLPFSDAQDFEDANAGLHRHHAVPRPTATRFSKATRPPTVNPSLWREAQLDAINGLFKVDGRRLSSSRAFGRGHDHCGRARPASS